MSDDHGPLLGDDSVDQGDGVNSHVDETKVKAAKQILAQMSPEQVKAKMEEMKARMKKMDPKELERMKQLAKEKIDSKDLSAIASKINAAKISEMKAKLANMSPEEASARMARARGMMNKMDPEQLERMKKLAKAKLQNVDLKSNEIQNLVKASEVVAGVDQDADVALRPVQVPNADGSIVPFVNRMASVSAGSLSVEQLYEKMEKMGFTQAREQFLATLTQEQREELEKFTRTRNPGVVLMVGACKGDKAKAEEALRLGADVNYSEKQGDTVLMMASWFGKLDIVKLLIERKANIHLKNDNEQNALHYASMRGHVKIVKLLLAKGAGLEDEDNKGYTPIVCVAQFGHTALLEFFKRRGANLFHRDSEEHTILHWTAYNKHPLATTWILNEGIDIHAKDSKGRTSVHWAAKQGNQGILELLVEFIDEEGYTGLLHEGDAEGKTPLDLAMYYENTKATAYLKEVLRRQHGCMAVWDKLTCQSGIRPGKEMRNTARTVSAWLIIVMAISFMHAFCVIGPYSPTLPVGCIPALAIMTMLCYFLWFACNCVDPGFIEPAAGSTAHRKMKKGRVHEHKSGPQVILPMTGIKRSGGYEQTANVAESEMEMELFEEDDSEIVDGEIVASPDFKLDQLQRKEAKRCYKVGGGDIDGDYPEDAAPWTLPYNLLLERGRFDAICVTCGITKPLRSKHCKHCGRCVSRFDHHCPWIDNCVAENNRRQFVLLAVAQTTTTWFYAVMCGIHMHHHSCGDPLAFGLGLPFMIHACLVATWGLALAFEHVNLAFSNITTNEKMNQHRYSYMRDPDGNPRNPFDAGFADNCLQFFGFKPWADWRTLDINTKFLPPGKKGCCSAHGKDRQHGHGHNDAHNDEHEGKVVESSGADVGEKRGLLGHEDESLADLESGEVGSGVGL